MEVKLFKKKGKTGKQLMDKISPEEIQPKKNSVVQILALFVQSIHLYFHRDTQKKHGKPLCLSTLEFRLGTIKEA